MKCLLKLFNNIMLFFLVSMCKDWSREMCKDWGHDQKWGDYSTSKEANDLWSPLLHPSVGRQICTVNMHSTYRREECIPEPWKTCSVTLDSQCTTPFARQMSLQVINLLTEAAHVVGLLNPAQGTFTGNCNVLCRSCNSSITTGLVSIELY